MSESLIIRCPNQDSLGRDCNQYKLRESKYCDKDNGGRCNHLSTQFLKKELLKEGQVSEEAKEWLQDCHPELYDEVKDY